MNLKELRQQIGQDRYKVISFDLFDTLLVRPCLQPTDILKLVGCRCGYEGNFLEMRRAAEKRARKRSNGEEISYDEIYSNLSDMFELSDELVNNFKKEELNIEKQYLYARKSMKEIFDYSVSLGKKVIIVSDIYLPKSFIADILKKNGFEGYEDLYVSSEYKVMKSSGNLYKVVLRKLEREGVKPSEILHMGDNEKSDERIPKELGIKTAFIPRTNFLVRKNHKLAGLYNNVERKLDNSLLIGYAVNRTFDDPFRFYHPETYFYGSKYSIANMLFGPFFVSFVKWMLEDCLNENVDTLCMVYRDGYVPEKIYNSLAKYYDNVPNIRRLYLTRALINYAYGEDENGLLESINDMLYSDGMTVGDFIRRRLFVSNENEYQEVLGLFLKHGYKNEEVKVGRRDDLEAWIKELYPYFKKNSAKTAQCVKEYCEDVLKDAGKTAIYDVGYRGSVCHYLKKRLGIDTYGYHLFAKESLNTRDVYVKYPIVYGLMTEKECELVNCLTEDMLNAREASVKDIAKNADGTFSFITDDNYKEDGRIEMLQDYTIQFAEGFAALFGRDLQYLTFDIIQFFEFYCDFLKNATAIDTRIFRRMDMIDSSFMNPYARNMYREWEMNHRFKNQQDKILWQMKESIWNIGLNLDYRIKPTIIMLDSPKYLDSEQLNRILDFKNSQDAVSVRLMVETSEHSLDEYSKVFGKKNVDIIERIDMPRGYDQNVSIKLTEKDSDILEANPVLSELASELAQKHRDMGKGYAETLVCYWYKLFMKTIQLYDHDGARLGFAVWNKSSVMHRILEQICQKEGISVTNMNGEDFKKTSEELCKHLLDISQKRKERKRLRVGIYASMPRKGYSGGRTHALNLAECLAHEDDEVFFISKYLPMFVHEMKGNKGHNKINYVCTDDLITDEAYENNFGGYKLDYLIIAPHKDKDEGFYINARGLSIRMNAKLVLVNYETPNWMNKYLNEVQDEGYWKPWRDVCIDGCLILSSAKESMKYAKEYYKDNTEYTRFDYWYPTINSIVADRTKAKKEKQIIAFVRPGAKWKGTDDIFGILSEKVSGYKVVLICGYGLKDHLYYGLLKQIKDASSKYNLDIRLMIQPSDEVKFSEIRRSEIMLFPSYFEGYGTPPIEAQYCDTLCLVYDLPVLRETCGDGVVYCKHGDYLDMKAKLEELIEDGVPEQKLHEKIYDIANFDRCSTRLHDMLMSHLNEEWRCVFWKEGYERFMKNKH